MQEHSCSSMKYRSRKIDFFDVLPYYPSFSEEHPSSTLNNLQVLIHNHRIMKTCRGALIMSLKAMRLGFIIINTLVNTWDKEGIT